MSQTEKRDIAAWSGGPLRLSLLAFLFLLLSGLAILLSPFGRGAQVSVLLHTVVGVAAIVPMTIYVWRHLAERWRDALSHLLFLGYASGVLLLVCVVTGVVLTVQAGAGRRISYAMDLIHIVTGIAVGGVIIAHLLTAAARHLKRSGETSRVVLKAMLVPTLWGTVLAVVPYAVAPAFPMASRRASLPEDYSYRYGPNPFAPSLATTDDGGAVHPSALSGSASCGTSGCHEEIHGEWAPSAHRYASRSKFFQAIQGTMAAQNGAESTRYCAGCHDPIALFSGAKNIYSEDLSAPGADEGISCASCHSITETDIRGNANYVLTPPERYLFEASEGAGRFLSDFLIRAYPKKHRESFSRPLLKTPEFCAACHKQFIDEEINAVGWVQLQNQYDAWRKSNWFKPDEKDPSRPDPEKALTCRECHMPLTESGDPAAGDTVDPVRSPDDGRHRSHRYLGANQWLPVLHDLEGGQEQVRLTEKWLRGELMVPEIAERWIDGPVIPITIQAPETVRPGEKLHLKVLVTNRKAGHDFPTGPLDIIQAWVEIKVTTPDGDVIFTSGTVDEKGFLQDGALVFKAEGVDRAGNLIDRHNLWEMVGARFRRSLFPGTSDREEFVFTCPGGPATPRILDPDGTEIVVPKDAPDRLLVSARLRYRKVDQTLIEFVMPGQGLTAPITDMSEATAEIRVESP